MAKGGTESADFGRNEEENISNWSVSKLISSLKSTFLPKDFSRVEAVLAAREDKLRQEIEALRRENDLFFKKSRLEKMSLETDLKRSKKESEEMRKEVSKLREDNEMVKEREKSTEERCQKLLDEVNGIREKHKATVSRMAEMEKEMIDIRGRDVLLVSENAKLKDELRSLNKRFVELEKRVLSLESDISLMKSEEFSKGGEIEGENGNAENVAVKFDEIVKLEEVSPGPGSDSLVKASRDSRNAGSGRPPSQNIIEIPDSDDDCTPAENVSGKERTLLHLAGNSHSDQVGEENGSPAPKRKRTSCSNVSERENCNDDDGNTLFGKSKTKKVENPVRNPNDTPINHQSYRTISSDNNKVDKGHTTARSQTLMNGFPLDGLGFTEGSSSDSDSDSDDDNDGMQFIFNHSKLAPESQRENRN